MSVLAAEPHQHGPRAQSLGRQGRLFPGGWGREQLFFRGFHTCVPPHPSRLAHMWSVWPLGPFSCRVFVTQSVERSSWLLSCFPLGFMPLTAFPTHQVSCNRHGGVKRIHQPQALRCLPPSQRFRVGTFSSVSQMKKVRPREAHGLLGFCCWEGRRSGFNPLAQAYCCHLALSLHLPTPLAPTRRVPSCGPTARSPYLSSAHEPQMPESTFLG